jgi:hypothetical protein
MIALDGAEAVHQDHPIFPLLQDISALINLDKSVMKFAKTGTLGGLKERPHSKKS